jgi:hypothetical protein
MLVERTGDSWSFFRGEPASTTEEAVSVIELICQLADESGDSCTSLPEPDAPAKLRKLRRTAATLLDEKPENLVGKTVINHASKEKASWKVESVEEDGQGYLVVVRSGGVLGLLSTQGRVRLRDMWKDKNGELHMPAPILTK